MRTLGIKHIHKKHTSEYFRVLILRTIGNFLVLSSLFMIGKTFYQPIREEIRYFIDSQIKKKYIVAEEGARVGEDQLDSHKGLLSRMFPFKTVEILVPIDPQFSVVIPKIAANTIILSNINVTDEKNYLEALKKGVAHAEGTAFPGEDGHIYLFAHSTDYIWNVGTYNAVFYLLYKLEKTDEINIFYKGKRHLYTVIDKTVVDPNQVEYLTRKTDTEFLTLQTCWPPGTTLKRLLVFAAPVKGD